MVKEILQSKGIRILHQFANFGIVELETKRISFLEKNANVLSKKKQLLLFENVKRDGALSSLPFVVYREEKDDFLVISGNHRVSSAINAGLEKIPCIISLKRMTSDDILRVQLSHNSIHGTDDKDILMELLHDFEDIEMQYLAGVDREYLKSLPRIESPHLESFDFSSDEEVVFFFNYKKIELIQQRIKELVEDGKYVALVKEKGKQDFIDDLRVIAKDVKMDGIVNLNILLPVMVDLMSKAFLRDAAVNEIEQNERIPCFVGNKIFSISLAEYEILKKKENFDKLIEAAIGAI